MTTIAQRVADTILTHCPGTFSLYSGYGVAAGKTIRFYGGVQQSERRNDKGRCIFASYRYADNSVLEYRYDAAQKTYTLTPKTPRLGAQN